MGDDLLLLCDLIDCLDFMDYWSKLLFWSRFLRVGFFESGLAPPS